VIPVGEDAARCGLACGRGDAREMLKRFLRKRFGEVEHSESRVWPVLTGGPVSKTFGDGLLLVGDVAAQTKPTTGGGSSWGPLCCRGGEDCGGGSGGGGCLGGIPEPIREVLEGRPEGGVLDDALGEEVPQQDP